MRIPLLSAKSEYACVSLLELALHYHDPAPLSLKAIADTHSISQRFLVQIFLQLRRAGLVASTRGATGGYHLTRPPEEISLGDIITVVEGIPPEDAPDTNGDSTPLKLALQSAWTEILASATLADLVRRAQTEFDLVYQI